MVRGLKFGILEEEGLYYLCSENKVLVSCAVTAQLFYAFFLHMQKAGFLITRLIYFRDNIRDFLVTIL